MFLFIAGAGLILPHRADALLDSWQKPLREADTLVKTGDYPAAERIAHRVADEVSHHLGPSSEVAETLGIAVALRSLATVGLGDLDHGVWLWHTALNIDPRLENLNLEQYRGPGSFLAQHPLETEEELRRAAGAEDEGAAVQPPKVHRRRNLRFPLGAEEFRHRGPLAVTFLVRADGTLANPIVTEQPPPVAEIYAALDALWEWQVEPARAAGDPVPAVYRLSVKFTLR
ncbi:MAG: energy transducer TonB [Acidobacteria bacterium]|nr:energy transducer TonB [Acidobacteriota bacterium]